MKNITDEQLCILHSILTEKGPSFTQKVEKEIAKRKKIIKTSDSVAVYLHKGTKSYDFYETMSSIHNVDESWNIWSTYQIFCCYIHEKHYLYKCIKDDIHPILRDVKVLETKHKWKAKYEKLWE